MFDRINNLRRLIQRAKIEEAIDALDELANILGNRRIIDEITLQASSYYQFKFENRQGKSENNWERNKVISALIEITNSLEEELNLKNKDEIEITREKKSVDQFDLDEKMLISKQIDILCYSCKGIFEGYNYHIEQAIKKGANVRIMHVKPNSQAYELMLAHTKVESIKSDINTIQDRIKWLGESLSESKKEVLGSYEVRYITWIPSTNILIFDRDLENGVVSVKHNPVFYTTPMKQRISSEIIFKRENLEKYTYYLIQYEHLWMFNDADEEGFKERIKYYGEEILKK